MSGIQNGKKGASNAVMHPWNFLAFKFSEFLFVCLHLQHLHSQSVPMHIVTVNLLQIKVKNTLFRPIIWTATSTYTLYIVLFVITSFVTFH